MGDVEKFNIKRKAISEELGKLSNNGKNKLDPIVVCPKFRAMADTERAMVTYMTNNKDWCSIPDDAIKTVKASSVRSAEYAKKACEAAAIAKKAQDQAAQGGSALSAPQKLPQGPL